MDWLVKGLRSRERGAALIIVLAFVVLFAGLGVAYLSRTTSDRQVADSSFNQSSVDQLAQSAMETSSAISDRRSSMVPQVQFPRSVQTELRTTFMCRA